MNAQAAQEMGLHIGSVIQIPFYTDHETQTATSYANLGKPFLTIKIKMVGEVIPQGDVVLSDIDSLGAAQVIFSPALARALAPECTTGTEVMLQLRGGENHNNKQSSRPRIASTPTPRSSVRRSSRASSPRFSKPSSLRRSRWRSLVAFRDSRC